MMTFAELGKKLEEETVMRWRDSSDMHGWTYETTLSDGKFLTIGFPENNQTGAEVGFSVEDEDGKTYLCLSFNLEHGYWDRLIDCLNALFFAEIR